MAKAISKAKLLQTANDLGIEGADLMSAKALRRAIAEATAQPPLPTAAEIEAIVPAEAPAAEAPPAQAPAKPKKVIRQPLTSAQVSAKVAAGLASIGQIEGGPVVGGPWHSPAGRDHVVTGVEDIGGGWLRVHTLRPSDGRTFTAKTRRIVRDICKQSGVAGASVAPATVCIS